MKHKMEMSVIALLLTVLAIVLVLTGCPNAAGGKKEKGGGAALSLTGTVWQANIAYNPMILTFTSENSGTYGFSGGSGTFSCTADTITLTGTMTGSYNYTISGNTLTIKRLYLNTDISFTKQ
ncbi:hypothetical protein V1L52_00380 [Treponema sp. HNW]|uniref:hypothetical protein n=1 Tax=Treponema sp. HNW TaxID=3116654 RepID=UPI003D119AA3